ncbi:MAG TPA: type II CAAX endopeptidase family protein [Polyangiaceae bacterium]|nr:type II CAAX endopeptidase family protein [Polyangiaceae bacterium]
MKSRIPPPPQSFEERISRVRLWTVLPAVFVPMIVWNVINRHVEISAGVARWAAELLLWSSALGWWLLKAAPRPLSLRAALGRSLDLAGWGLVAWAMLANTSVRIVWWMARYCRDILQVASTSGSYTFRLPRTKVDALFAVSAAVLAPLVEELIFRGTLFRSCRVRFGPVKAALLSSALFALGHIDRDSMAIFVSALTYVLAYTRTRSLWAPIVLHAINNGGWGVLSKYSLGATPEFRLNGSWQFGLFGLVLLLGVAAWIVFVRKSWRTLGDALPPDSLQPAPAASHSSLPEPQRAVS